MKHKKLNIILLYNSGHLGSMIVLNKILKMKCFKVVGIVKASNIDFSEKGLLKVSKNIRKIGLFLTLMLVLQRLIYILGFLITFIFPFYKRKLRNSSQIAAEYNIPLILSNNINSPDTLKFIEELKPDITVSAYFPQILKKEALAIPRMGTLNIHPGWLPEYKGAMVYFWALTNNENSAGVSVHWMDEGIDTGPLLARKAFKLKKNITQEDVLMKTAVIGSRLLNRLGNQLVRGKTPQTIDITGEKSHYYSMPNSKAFNSYSQHHSFINFKTSLGLIIGWNRF